MRGEDALVWSRLDTVLGKASELFAEFPDMYRDRHRRREVERRRHQMRNRRILIQWERDDLAFNRSII